MGLAMAAEGSGLMGTAADPHGMRDASYELYQMSADANYGAEFRVMHQIVEQAYQSNLQNAHAVTNQIALDATREGIRIAAYISPVAAVIDTGIEAANGNKSGGEIAVELATLGVGRKARAAERGVIRTGEVFGPPSMATKPGEAYFWSGLAGAGLNRLPASRAVGGERHLRCSLNLAAYKCLSGMQQIRLQLMLGRAFPVCMREVLVV